jgi:hypothetical protein
VRRLTQLPKPPKFHLDDDNIYVSVPGGARQGPYRIASVDTTWTPVRYQLSLGDGALVDNGALFEETKLIRQN